jgi:CheY-like chemotaxis protein
MTEKTSSSRFLGHSLSSSAEKTIVVIDDNPGDLRFWSTALRGCLPHYVVLDALGGQASLNLCRSQRVDCVVLDLDMPGLSGLELLFNLIPNRHSPTVAVVVLTQLSSPILQEMTMQYGAQGCFVKQYTSPEVLARAIEKAIISIGFPRSHFA